MEQISWSRKFSVGNRELDKEHQELLALVNRIIVFSNYSIKGREDKIKAIIKELIDKANKHFENEIKFLERIGYSGIERHETFHKKFIKELILVLKKSDVKELALFLANWIEEHFKEDRKYYEWIKRK